MTLCDFRNITKIQLNTGKIVSIDFDKGIYPNELGSINIPGLYHIIATGSFHLYFDGKEWLSEYNSRDKEFRPGFLVLDFYNNLNF